MSITQNFIKKLKGETRFVTDIIPGNFIYGLIVHSTIPRGKILSINVPDLPEDYIVAGYKDIPGKNKIVFWEEKMPLLVENRVNYQGQPILLLGGPKLNTLKLIASKIKIEYIEEESVLSLEKVTINSLDDNFKHVTGNISEAFLKAEKTLCGEYKTCLQYPDNIENDCSIAIWNEYQNIVYTSCNNPFILRNNIVNVINIPKKKIRVIVPTTSAPLGGKMIIPTILSCCAILLAYLTKKAVKIAFNTTAPSGFNTRKYPFHLKYVSALDENDIVTANKIDIQVDTGYYRLLAEPVINRIKASAYQFYSCKNTEINITLNRTNKAPIGGFSGIGEAEVCFARELHANRIAKLLHKDPLYWRKKNVSVLKKKTAVSAKNENGLGDVLEKVIAVSDFNRKYGAYEALARNRKSITEAVDPVRGIGLAVFPHLILSHIEPHGGRYSLKLTLGRDNKIRIKSSTIDFGDSKATLFSTVASEILDIHFSEVYLDQVDTYKVPDSGPTIGSRAVMILKKLVEQGCQTIKRKKKKEPAPLDVQKRFSPPGKAAVLGICREAAVVEVEVDPVTFEINCRGIWVAIDAGQIINPHIARVHVELSALRNFESALTDMNELEYLFNYTAPGALDIPPLSVHFLEKEVPDPPVSLGEQPVCCVAPALISAISQACLRDFTAAPVTPDLIQKMQEEK